MAVLPLLLDLIPIQPAPGWSNYWLSILAPRMLQWTPQWPGANPLPMSKMVNRYTGLSQEMLLMPQPDGRGFMRTAEPKWLSELR